MKLINIDQLHPFGSSCSAGTFIDAQPVTTPHLRRPLSPFPATHVSGHLRSSMS